jgi:hypothetical protein
LSGDVCMIEEFYMSQASLIPFYLFKFELWHWTRFKWFKFNLCIVFQIVIWSMRVLILLCFMYKLMLNFLSSVFYNFRSSLNITQQQNVKTDGYMFRYVNDVVKFMFKRRHFFKSISNKSNCSIESFATLSDPCRSFRRCCIVGNDKWIKMLTKNYGIVQGNFKNLREIKILPK